MDTTDKNISFDKNGICNYCQNFNTYKKWLRPYEDLLPLLDEIKIRNKDKEFDCIIGISGGVDSSYVAYQAYKHKLRAILVHVDNGTNSPEASENIHKISKYTGYPLKMIEVDEDEFKDMVKAYLNASVIDIEIPSDHAITATLCKMAIDTKIKYILSGGNYSSEGVSPKSWSYLKLDATNIKDIYAKFGKGKKIKHFPFFSYYQKKWHEAVVKDLQIIQILDYLNYDKEKAKKEMTKIFGWKDYGGKHYESVWTRFYQGYILPEKFGVDKRKSHYSSLINMGQLKRADALELLKKPPYSKTQLKKDREELLQWLGLSEEEFKEIMELPIREHTEFKNDTNIADLYRKIKRLIIK